MSVHTSQVQFLRRGLFSRPSASSSENSPSVRKNLFVKKLYGVVQRGLVERRCKAARMKLRGRGEWCEAWHFASVAGVRT